jgi:hypothetical protein
MMSVTTAAHPFRPAPTTCTHTCAMGHAWAQALNLLGPTALARDLTGLAAAYQGSSGFAVNPFFVTTPGRLGGGGLIQPRVHARPCAIELQGIGYGGWKREAVLVRAVDVDRQLGPGTPRAGMAGTIRRVSIRPHIVGGIAGQVGLWEGWGSGWRSGRGLRE